MGNRQQGDGRAGGADRRAVGADNSAPTLGQAVRTVRLFGPRKGLRARERSWSWKKSNVSANRRAFEADCRARSADCRAVGAAGRQLGRTAKKFDSRQEGS